MIKKPRFIKKEGNRNYVNVKPSEKSKALL